jgi:hypothetical protein
MNLPVLRMSCTRVEASPYITRKLQLTEGVRVRLHFAVAKCYSLWLLEGEKSRLAGVRPGKARALRQAASYLLFRINSLRLVRWGARKFDARVRKFALEIGGGMPGVML